MKLLERINKTVAPPTPAPVITSLDGRGPRFGLPAVGWSADLGRIMSVPRRDLTTSHTKDELDALEQSLRAPSGPCKCAEYGRACPTSLLPIQRLALAEAAQAGGLVAPIGVGHGKTLIDLLLPSVLGSKVAVLLIPANLRSQLLDRDIPFYGGHWTMPNIAAGRWFRPGLPMVHVITYNKLSTPDGTDLLKRINPDLIICDEAHNLKDRGATRTGRFMRYMASVPARLCVLSGTIASRSIKDYSHLAERALGDASPLPKHWPTVEEWARALDPGEVIAPPGMLAKLGEPGEDVREAFRRRRNDTLGVVATDESAVGNSLVIRRFNPGNIPPAVAAAINEAHRGVRPDGEEFVEQLQIISCARQLASGFFHRWKFPRGEPPELITDWFRRRQDFNRELRERLKHPREHLDSPGLCMRAAVRAYQQPPYEGPLPTWRAGSWRDWHAIHKAVHHESEAVWISDWVVESAAKWASDKKKPGIVWVEFPELGERIARAARVPYYGGGPLASEEIAKETGARSIVASIKAHGTGKNLAMFSRSLVVNPPADGATWEQLIGRTHRQGQRADTVEVEVSLHTPDLVDAFRKAREFARFIQATDGQPQKLLFADYDWTV